ncbi:G5 domain-containing protein [Ruminococcaceae bacterium OttesenSCG-928-L11]|nr:G5 domain-containing protein [Ruminococcaceae bacterium OttesenSCG-928-L11]
MSLVSLLAALTMLQAADSMAVYAAESDETEIEAGETEAEIPEEEAPEADEQETEAKIIKVERSASGLFAAYVEADGNRKKVMVSGGTVEQLVSKACVELGDMDVTSKPLGETVEPGDVIAVSRRSYATVTNKEVLHYETIMSYSPNVHPGKKEVLVQGEDGLRVEVLRQLIVDGEVVEETVKKDEVEKEPVAEVILMGFPSAPVSPLDFDCEFDANCEPLEYTSVHRGQKSAGYSAPAGAKTASGRDAIVGHVAVDPKVIPYGTKLFIKSTDNRHIYGYAIAADTGTALKQGLITVDLFYGSYEESCTNGIRDVDIFILE